MITVLDMADVKTNGAAPFLNGGDGGGDFKKSPANGFANGTHHNKQKKNGNLDWQQSKVRYSIR